MEDVHTQGSVSLDLKELFVETVSQDLLEIQLISPLGTV